MPLRVIGVAFFVGRAISYSVWAHLGRFASAFVDPEAEFEGGYLSGYFIITQLALLLLVYLLMKFDWKMLIEQRKLRWRRAVSRPHLTEQSQTTKD